MTILSAIAAFKGAFLGALLGNNLPHKGFEPANPLRPGYGHHHRPYPTGPGYGHAPHCKPGHGEPFPDPGHLYPTRPSYPLFAFNR